MPTRDELRVEIAKVVALGCGCEVCIDRATDAVLALLAAVPGVAVPEPDEQQRCEHEPWHHVEGGCLFCPCLWASQPNPCRPAASPVALTNKED